MMLLPGGFAYLPDGTVIPEGTRWWAHGVGWSVWQDGRWGWIGGDPYTSAVEPTRPDDPLWTVWAVTPVMWEGV